MATNENSTNEHGYFINQLYRDFLFPTILGEDNMAILYWAGKRIARHYDLASFADVASFFENAQFCSITKLKERRNSMTFELSGQNVADRISSGNREFSLEAGALAEAIQKESNKVTECEVKILDKAKKVQIIANFA